MTLTLQFLSRYKIETVMGKKREDELCGDIWCITVAQGIHKLLLFKHRYFLNTKKLFCLDVTMSTSHYHSLQSSWAREKI